MSFTSSTITQNFAFASGRTGVLQLLLLTQSDVDRLLGAHSGKEVEQILTELKLTNPIDQGIDNGDDILHAVAQWVRQEVETMSPKNKQQIFSILWMENDAPLMAYRLKKQFGLTSEVSKEPPTEDEVALAYHLNAIEERVKFGDPTPQEVDTAVSQYVADAQLKLADESGSAHIKTYVQHLIDLHNIRTAVRLAGNENVDHRTLMLKGGTLNPKELCGSLEDLAKVIDRSPITFTLGSYLANADKNELERMLADVLARDIAAMWNVPLSIEPLFAFAAIAFSQLKLIRAILIGKRNELSPQEVKALTPPFLSASHYIL